MKVVIDIEANGLDSPDQIWLIVCKDIETGTYYKFNNVTTNEFERKRFTTFGEGVRLWIGHNLLGYDGPVLSTLIPDCHSFDASILPLRSIDTLIISKLVDYSREQGHSVESYGEEFGIEKGQFYKFTDKELYNCNSILFKQMEVYCVRDVDICERIYRKYIRVISDLAWQPAITLEHQFQCIVNSLHRNGFSFNTVRATSLLEKVTGELNELDLEIQRAFPPRLKLIREVVPRVTGHGTLHKGDFRFANGDLSEFNGGPFCRCEWVSFNAASHKQVIDTLHVAGWCPVDKTQTHIDTEREIQRLKYTRRVEKSLDLVELSAKLEGLQKYGWKINENNLGTLPYNAPTPARLLARRILLESRRRTLTEWLGLVQVDGRIHGRFYGIGAWTHRMAHQQPNTANIPNEVYISTGKPKLLGKEMRQLWQAPKKRLLVGVDAEAIQLRVFAHLIDDPELTEAIVNGKKSEGTDPHSLNRKVFGLFCKTRNAAKHSLYAIFFGGRANKIMQIMACSKAEAEEGIQNLIKRYPGLARLEKETFPQDAKRGYFIGLDGRKVVIPDDTVSGRKHLCMSGYLQNGEAIIMKKATLKWHDLLKDDNAILVNLVHDEWQTECPNNVETALKIARIQADSLREVGEELGLKCPLAGSYWNDDHKDYTIGTNWYSTH